MEALREVFLKKCTDFACEPLPELCWGRRADLRSYLLAGPGQEQQGGVLQFNGNSKMLFNKRVSYMQVVALCEAMYEDTHVVDLDLSYNRLNDMAAQSIARLIKMNKKLLRINLAGNELTAAGAGHLAEALSQSDVILEGLNLAGNDLGDKGVGKLGDMLRCNASLLSLDISGTSSGIRGLISVCTALGGADEAASGINSTLLSLDIGSPIFKGGPQDTTTLVIAQMLANNSTLQALGLSKHGLVDSGFETLVTYGLLRNGSLTSLDLRANKLSAFSGANLERLLNDSPRLSSINLASNQLSDGGALSIARSLPYMHWLTHLDLRANNIGEQGLVALAEALSLASNLQVFLLWGNNFGPAACRAFLDTLSQAGSTAGSASSGLGALQTDIQAYEVDGRAQVALRETATA